jgi:hypothetical protein
MRRRYASAAAEALALEHGLDNVEIIGTGRDGLVTLADVRALIPEPPAGLGESGTALWLRVHRDWRLRPDEEELLLAACRTIDETARLEFALAGADVVVTGSRGQSRAHPLVREIREHRLALKQLLGAAGIGISDLTADGEIDRGAARSAAGRALARQRWSRRHG